VGIAGIDRNEALKDGDVFAERGQSIVQVPARLMVVG